MVIKLKQRTEEFFVVKNSEGKYYGTFIAEYESPASPGGEYPYMCNDPVRSCGYDGATETRYYSLEDAKAACRKTGDTVELVKISESMTVESVDGIIDGKTESKTSGYSCGRYHEGD